MVDVAGMRRDYDAGALEREDLGADPIAAFERWLAAMVEAGEPDANAMVLATAAPDGAPSARTVLLRGVDARGLVFYTNRESRKGRELGANPRAALVFVWLAARRQVLVTGTVEEVSEAESDAYFASRPRGSQLAAWASPQSAPVPSRADLDAAAADMAARFAGREVPRPSFWGGYRVVPDAMEFWQGRADRLHDRFRFDRREGGWDVERLGP
ncbi:MAG TPA: pyridoxamine 5'-phosphate oxidase [Acidimicrobiales bacterium]|nr:pyridoxamine 5'-phosphate oxidase [Acidimicrobiales bacterium]